MKKIAASFFCVLFLLLNLTLAHAVIQTNTWTGSGDGVSYSDSDNWSLKIVPCNFGTVEFIVIIPPGFTVNHDVSGCEVKELKLGEDIGNDSRLNFLNGSSLTALDMAEIYGIMHADNALFYADPFCLLGDRTRVWGENGANVAIGSGDPLNGGKYSSTGLWASALYSHTRYWELFNVSSAGTLLDLSSVLSIDAGFNDNDGDDYNIQQVIASSGGKIDLSGVETVTAPAGLRDHIDFMLSGAASVIDLESLHTLTSVRGSTRFAVTNEGTLYLPSLESANQVTFELNTGATVSVDDPSDGKDPPPAVYSSTGLWASALYSHTRYWELFNVSGAGTLLDLSSVLSIDAGFNDNDGDDYNIQQIIVWSGGKIDLSAVETITAPTRAEDRLDFEITGGSIVLGNLSTLGSSKVTVTGLDLGPVDGVTAGELIVNGDINPDGPSDITITGIGSDPKTATLEVVGEINLNDPTILNLSEATLSVGGDLQFSLTDEEHFKAVDAIVHFKGSGTQLLEVGGLDVDIYVEMLPNGNFGFGQIIVGQEGTPTAVRLRDEIDNGNGYACWTQKEALYLGIGENYQEGLIINEDSTLVLDGVNLYVYDNGTWVHVNPLLPEGIDEIPWTGGGTIKKGCTNIKLAGDVNGDGWVNVLDLNEIRDNFMQSGDPSWIGADITCDGWVNVSDLNVVRDQFMNQTCTFTP
jgi:hypothetical protein